MTAENDTYDRYRTGQVFGPSAVNSSDSEAEAYPATSPKASDQLPKRNKRKNFKPRCSNVAAYSEAEALSDFAANDNINNNVRRRKTLATRRLVVDARHSPMDLSKTNDSDSNSDTDDYNDDDAAKIPSSFSIHTLSKPHVAEAGGAHPQVSDMREYAMNTMRELLGIYGLTSEVAESISRQLPIAAFSSGKIFENFTLNPGGKVDGGSPPSQPPTPPSTPLSPKSAGDLSNKYTSTTIPNIPNLIITHNSSPNIPQNFATAQKTPLNLGLKPKTTYANGLQGGEYSFADLEARGKVDDAKMGADQKGGQASRGIFPSSILPFATSQLKTDSSSPPPFEQSPLNAMMAQSLQPTPRDAVSTPNLLLNKPAAQLDYSKYVKKFSSSLECGSSYCKDLNYRWVCAARRSSTFYVALGRRFTLVQFVCADRLL
jgi:hypothetical protein